MSDHMWRHSFGRASYCDACGYTYSVGTTPAPCPGYTHSVAEPREVTELYRDLCRHPHLHTLVPSKIVGEAAQILYDLGYRKTGSLVRCEDEYGTFWVERKHFIHLVDDFGGAREEVTG